MKKILLPAAGLTVLALFVAAQNWTYVGAAKCALCHKTEKQGQQYIIWQKSNHSRSFAALSTPQAAQVGQALGVADPPNDPKCLKCHSPLAEKAAELKTDGVSCEVCHGPGSEYKKLAIMKDRAEAGKNGLILYANAEAIKAHCLHCHENPHGKPFDFAAAVEKIKHPGPAK